VDRGFSVIHDAADGGAFSGATCGSSPLPAMPHPTAEIYARISGQPKITAGCPDRHRPAKM